MKTIRNISLAALVILVTTIKGFSSINTPMEPIATIGAHEMHVSPKAQQSAKLINSHAAGVVSFLNYHQSPVSPQGKSTKRNFLATEAGYINASHSLSEGPFSKGVSAHASIKYCALLSVGCVWDITWGTKQSDSQSINPPKSNHMCVAVIMSNPVKLGKTESAFMHKLDTNLTLETLSIVEVVVNFAKF